MGVWVWALILLSMIISIDIVLTCVPNFYFFIKISFYIVVNCDKKFCFVLQFVFIILRISAKFNYETFLLSSRNEIG